MVRRILKTLPKRVKEGPVFRALKVAAGTAMIVRELGKKAGKKRGEKRLLILNHNFAQDLRFLLKANTDFDIRVISNYSLNLIFRGFVNLRPNEWDRFLDSEYEKERAAYLNFFIRRLLPVIRRLNFSAFITPSDIYPSLRDIIGPLKEAGLTTIVIDKEGTISPYFFTYYANEIKTKYPLLCDHILVWSRRQKKFWALAGVKPDRITVTGQPRSDFWFSRGEWKKRTDLLPSSRPERKLVLFFSFSKSAYIAPELYNNGTITWDRLFRDTHSAVLELAEAHPDTDFVIKTHPQQDFGDKPFLERIRALPNVFLMGGPRISNDLITMSDVVAGFLTTGLIEAMVCGKQVVYAFWGDVREKWADNVIPFHQSRGLFVAESRKAFKTLILEALGSDRVPEDQIRHRKPFIDEYFDRCDGHASARTLERINDILKAQH